jgi:hypothetical protein
MYMPTTQVPQGFPRIIISTFYSDIIILKFRLAFGMVAGAGDTAVKLAMW